MDKLIGRLVYTIILVKVMKEKKRKISRVGYTKADWELQVVGLDSVVWHDTIREEKEQDDVRVRITMEDF